MFNSFGSYWISRYGKNTTTPKEFQECLLDIKKCTVCARGGIMISTIRLGNTLDPTDRWIAKGTKSNQKHFSIEKMKLMETMYENTNIPFRRNSIESLANIMCNIIANGDYKFNTVDYLTKWGINV